MNCLQLRRIFVPFKSKKLPSTSTSQSSNIELVLYPAGYITETFTVTYRPSNVLLQKKCISCLVSSRAGDVSWKHNWPPHQFGVFDMKIENPARLAAPLSDAVRNIVLKLYCGYKYTRHFMINRVWGLKQL